MKSITTAFLLLPLFLLPLKVSLAGASTEDGWRGLVPLRSLRTDVERVLGPGTNECKCAYYLDDVNVFIVYASGDCKSGGTGGWNVSPNTVIRMTVVPKPNPPLSDLNLNLGRFKKKQDPEIAGNMYYVDDEQGFSLEVYEGTQQALVSAFFHQPAAKYKHLRCP